MKYFIVNGKVVTDRTNSTDEAYRGLVYDTLQEARDYWKYVLPSEYNSLGMTSSSNKIKEELFLKNKIKEVESTIRAKEEHLKQFYDGKRFTETEEWKRRQELNDEYNFYRLESVVKKLEMYEALVWRVYEIRGVKSIARIPVHKIEKGVEVPWLFTEEESKAFRDKYYKPVWDLEEEEFEAQKRYYAYHKSVELPNKGNHETLKAFLLDDLSLLKNLKREYHSSRLYNHYLSPGSNEIIIKKVKDLVLEDIQYSPDKGFNMITIRKGKPLEIRFASSFKNRNVLLCEKEKLLKNNDIVIMSKDNSGYNQYTKLKHKTFREENELYRS